jgi:beta-1,2-mannobiose phosphorylase / 1,2-beta-oligomannan phosphorylase
MRNFISCVILLLIYLIAGCRGSTGADGATNAELFPPEIVKFDAYEKNPVFQGAGRATWDWHIRERGYILRETDGYHMWYTGYNDSVSNPVMYLGYATSKDGIAWERYAGNPIFKNSWVEDMCVVKTDSAYLMFAEGEKDIAHMLSSYDKVNWKDHGSLQIYYTDGTPLSAGPYGTPTAFLQNGVWYLFYERNDEGIWLATSTDLLRWKNVQDEPVLKKGPESYDKFGVAVNQVIKYKDKYYAYYHGTAFEDWHEWSTNVAVSDDLKSWEKYTGNPIARENKSSGILVDDGSQYRLYTMHPEVCLHFPGSTN